MRLRGFFHYCDSKFLMITSLASGSYLRDLSCNKPPGPLMAPDFPVKSMKGAPSLSPSPQMYLTVGRKHRHCQWSKRVLHMRPATSGPYFGIINTLVMFSDLTYNSTVTMIQKRDQTSSVQNTHTRKKAFFPYKFETSLMSIPVYRAFGISQLVTIA